MRPYAVIIFLAIIFQLLLALSALADYKFQEVNSYTIPGIQNIGELDLGDIDRDGIPEIVCADTSLLGITDNASYILYSLKADSALVRIKISALNFNKISRRVLIDDINRDSLLDVVIGGFTTDYANGFGCSLTVCIIDGANMLAADFFVDTLIYYTRFFSNCNLSNYIGSFTAFDINNDGYNEFLLSFDSSIAGYWLPPWWYAETRSGLCRLYYSFPDSIIWTQSLFIEKPGLILQQDNNWFLSTGRIYGYYKEIPMNPDQIICYENIGVLDSEGNFSAITQADAESFFEPACIGNIMVDLEGIEVLSAAGNWLYIYNSSPPEELVLVDSHQYESPVSSCIYFPGLPGNFVGLYNDEFKIFNSDGSVAETIDLTPHGKYQWVYPFKDGIPYLAVINGNEVKLYELVQYTSAGREEASPIPDLFSVGNPFPNPFNNSQTIPVKINRGSVLTVDVYNLLGQQIEIIYQGRPQAIGEINITWNPGNIPSGIYFIKATAGNETRVVRSILLK